VAPTAHANGLRSLLGAVGLRRGHVVAASSKEDATILAIDDVPGARHARSVLTGKDVYRGLESAIDRADAVGRVLDGIALGALPGPPW